MDSYMARAAQRVRWSRLRYVAAIAAMALVALPPLAHGQVVSFGQIRPFVTGWIPVVGPGGAVGGVSIDVNGVVARIEVDRGGELRVARVRALEVSDSELHTTSPLRKVSLRKLQAEIERRRQRGEPVTDELQNLAGLQRVELVLLYAEQRDIVLAGPAEPWDFGRDGIARGRTSGRPPVQLDDLIVALRTASAAADERITCSIDPSREGSLKLQRLLSQRGLQLNEQVVSHMEETLGPHQITLTGVPPSSHFAHVLVAADFLMKRLGMDLEPSPVEGLPSYMELLQTGGGPAPRSAMPRWWLAPNYEALARDEEGLAWQLRGVGVKTLSEEGRLRRDGSIAAGGARKTSPTYVWAEAMTERYEALCSKLPVFAELRNCMDLAVVAALVAKEDLARKSGCDLSLLLDEKRIQVAEYHTPRTVDSRASLVRKGRSWIVGVSGGVELDSWSVLQQQVKAPELTDVRAKAVPTSEPRWWWD